MIEYAILNCKACAYDTQKSHKRLGDLFWPTLDFGL